MLAGFLANVKITWIKNYLIRDFLSKYPVNMTEAIRELPEDYEHFNDFFTRHLKPGLRPVAAADVISPVDGFVSEFGSIKKGQLLQAKGKYYSVDELLAAHQTDAFQTGSFITLYLSPSDYHRVHMPISGELQHMIHVPGSLFSVQPATTQHIPRLFARNERLVNFFETKLGPMAAVLVGATLVGAMGTRWQGDLKRVRKQTVFDVPNLPEFSEVGLKQADELGYFKLGSTVILLFAHPIQWTENLKQGMAIRLGQALGQALKKS